MARLRGAAGLSERPIPSKDQPAQRLSQEPGRNPTNAVPGRGLDPPTGCAVDRYRLFRRPVAAALVVAGLLVTYPPALGRGYFGSVHGMSWCARGLWSYSNHHTPV